jgi:antitoxin Phd
MKTWPVQDAKARFSEMLETCLKEGPQLVTKRGSDAAVLVPVQLWSKVESARKPVLKELLLGDRARGDLKPPARGRLRWRKPQPFS